MKVWLPTIRAGSGADVFTDRLAQGLRRAGHEVEVTWLKHGYEIWPSLSRHRPPLGTDIIHANSWSAFAFSNYGIPTVATDHGFVLDPEFVRTKGARQRLYHKLLITRHVAKSFKECAAVTAVSHYLAKVIQPHRKDVAAIPNWIDTDLFQPSDFQSRNDVFRLLYAGGSSFHKGFDVFRKLVKKKDDALEFWCQRSLGPRLGQCAAKVQFFDPTSWEEMPKLYARCDAVLMPSRYEGFGYVAAEAMACARPVVGFDCRGLNEVCGDVGILVPMDNLSALEQSIDTLASDRLAAARLGERGRERVLAEFTERKAISAYVNVYRGLQ